ncbi:hypothetical protein Nepgr_008742 [Nepenthes gracilis]|uniref:Uncharacterized protein n=1 Tax=Nepenthes gracilis TaxID=150966 RepID=A0AAD3SA06_NEPGR|nr:hypothetical protein Nepgr_008742 [Nepenthes gracilis]
MGALPSFTNGAVWMLCLAETFLRTLGGSGKELGDFSLSWALSFVLGTLGLYLTMYRAVELNGRFRGPYTLLGDGFWVPLLRALNPVG